MGNTNVKRKVYTGLGSLQAFIGLGALAGGFGLVKDPSGSARNSYSTWCDLDRMDCDSDRHY